MKRLAMAAARALMRGGRALARYAAARPTSDTARAFDAARLPETPLQLGNATDRASLRNQARYEYQNNPHASGIARLFSLYVCGAGPRLRWRQWEEMIDAPTDERLQKYVERRWEEFATVNRFPSLLRQAMRSIVVDGEAFLCLYPTESGAFSVDLLDSQRIGNPDGKPSTSTLQDGVYFNAFGEPIAYCVYRVPERESSGYDATKYDAVPASQIFHLFREDFAGQTRGVSWFAPSMVLLQQLREYTEATVEAAKAGARVWATVETQNGFSEDYLDLEGGVPYDAYRTFETPNGRYLQLPAGTTMRGFNPSQPSTAADAYTANLLSQIGYSMGLPRNKATGSSHEYNFASGRLDNQPFELLISTLQRDMLELGFCDPLFGLFYETIEEDLHWRFPDAPTLAESDWSWEWPAPPLVDAEATARTNAILIKSGQKTLREVWESLHPNGNYEDAAKEIERDRERFPEMYGATPEPEGAPETRIAEPVAPNVDHEDGEE